MEQIFVFTRNWESAFESKEYFLAASSKVLLRISHGSKNFKFWSCVTSAQHFTWCLPTAEALVSISINGVVSPEHYH